MNNNLNKQPISRDEIKFPYALPSNMNNVYQKQEYFDRNLHNSRDNQPVQSNIQFDKVNQYQFESYNQEKEVNKYMDFNPVDTRQQQFNLNRHSDVLYNYNTQGNINNFVDNTPTSTRENNNRQIRGIDTNLLPTRRINIPPDNI
tara:strand:+ start:1560 stop:1994 length:435 start_codon:yes stop_codon:yes gene_type:complete